MSSFTVACSETPWLRLTTPAMVVSYSGSADLYRSAELQWLVSEQPMEKAKQGTFWQLALYMYFIKHLVLLIKRVMVHILLHKGVTRTAESTITKLYRVPSSHENRFAAA